MYVLEAVNGPLDGKRWEFDRDIEIGRDAALVAAALPVDSAVSRRHARLENNGENLVLVDLNSSNGTVLRGKPITAPTAIHPEDVFLVGRTLLRVFSVS